MHRGHVLKNLDYPLGSLQHVAWLKALCEDANPSALLLGYFPQTSKYWEISDDL